MPIYDYQCRICDHVHERIVKANSTNVFDCPKCDRPYTCKRIITASGVYLGNDDAAWIKTVLEVVDKDSKAAHTQRFLKNPSRANYKAWMKGEGLRPLENNDRQRPEHPDESKRAAEMFRRHQQRNRIEVG